MVIMTDRESIQKVAPENCDRLNKRLDCGMSSTKTLQAIPNLILVDNNLTEDNGLESNSTPGEGKGMASDASTNTIAIVEVNNFSESSFGKRHAEPIGSSDISHPGPTIPASLDCIRVLSPNDSVKFEERSASARSTRRAKKTRKQAKRFGFWVLSKIFV